MGRRPVDKLVVDLQAYAADEMKRRGVTKTVGFSESRLAIWREVLSAFADHMPSSHALLARIQLRAQVAQRFTCLRQIKAAVHVAVIDTEGQIPAAAACGSRVAHVL